MAMGGEDGLQMGMFQCLQLDFLPKDLIIIHIPNGGLRNKWEAVKLKRMGVKAGAGDFLFHWPVILQKGDVPFMDTGYIEVKFENGELSGDQEDFREEVWAMGGKYAVARKYETVRDTLIGWGVKCQHRVQF